MKLRNKGVWLMLVVLVIGWCVAHGATAQTDDVGGYIQQLTDEDERVRKSGAVRPSQLGPSYHPRRCRHPVSNGVFPGPASAGSTGRR